MNKQDLKSILNGPAGKLNQHLVDVVAEAKKEHKYGAIATEIERDDIIYRFPSGREAGRFCALHWHQKLGIIRRLRLQVRYQLNAGGNFSFEYVADFVYFDVKSKTEIVEDSKGYMTPEYRKKKKLMFKIYGIKIKET